MEGYLLYNYKHKCMFVFHEIHVLPLAVYDNKFNRLI